MEVWPDNWAIYELFCELHTQWIMGPGGPTGINYEPLFRRLDRMKLDDERYEEIFRGFRAMEAEALTTLNSAR